MQTAQRAVPGMIPFFVAYPGTPFTSSGHFAVFMRGDTPLTSRLLKPALVNATTGEFTDVARHALVRDCAVACRSRCTSATTAACRSRSSGRCSTSSPSWCSAAACFSGCGARRGRSGKRQPRSPRPRYSQPTMNTQTMKRPKRQSLGAIFLVPAVLAVLTCVGLVSALLGDDLWDGLSWLDLVGADRGGGVVRTRLGGEQQQRPSACRAARRARVLFSAGASDLEVSGSAPAPTKNGGSLAGKVS